MESSSAVLSQAFHNVLVKSKHQQAYWYGLDTGSHGAEYTLCTLLGIPPDQYDLFLLSFGLLKAKKDGKLQSSANNTETFCNQLTSDYGYNWTRFRAHRKEKETAFICIGKFFGEDFSAQHQQRVKMKPPEINKQIQEEFISVWTNRSSFNIITPSRLSNGVSRMDVLKSRGQQREPQTKRPAKDITPDKETYKNSPLPERNQVDVSTILSIISLNLFNKICDPCVFDAIDVNSIFSKALSLEDVMDSLANTMMEVQNQEEERQQKKKAAFQYATNPRILTLNPVDYPFLTDKGVDVTCSQQVQSMLRDVVRMKQDEKDILKFAQYNSKPTTLVRVPFSFNTTMFNKRGKLFVNDMLEAMVPPPLNKVNVSDVANEEMMGGGPENDGRWTGVEHAAEALIVHLGKKFGAAFVSAGDKIGMPVMKEQKKMSAATTAAMLDDAAITQSSLAVLRKYHVKQYGWWFGAPSNKIAELSVDVVPPIVGSAIVREETINYWWKNPRIVIEKKVCQVTKRLPNLLWNNLDIVIGGDHGQGSFRMSAKVILRQNRKKVKKFEVGLGDVECPKDSYEVLKATLSGVINESLKEIVNYERDINGKITKDGSYKTIKKIRLDGSPPLIYNSFKHTLENDEEVILDRPLRLFIGGDLAFYAMVLGMKGSETHACWLCLLKKVSQWEKDPFKKGEERTMQWILSNYEKAAEKQERIHGLIEQPLFDAIEVCRYIVPPLHTMLGIANTILTDFKSFVEFSLEKVPMQLREARVLNTKGELCWKEAKKSLNDFDVVNGPKLATLQQNQMDGCEHLQYLLEFEEEMTEDIDETEQEVVEINLEIDDLNDQRRVLVEALNVASTKWTEAKHALKKSSFEKESKGKKKKIYYTKPIKARIERVLRKYGIDIAAYHGGDLVGNDCRKLMANAAMVFVDIAELLDEVCREQGMSDGMQESVADRCRGVANALVVFDCIFSIVNKQNEDVDLEEDHKHLSSLVKTSLTCWINLKDVNQRGQRNIPPKVHAIVQHLVEQFRSYGGIGDFDESFVELSHQTGKRDMLRSKAMRDRELKYSFISKWDETRTNPLVMAVKEEMAKRKREYKDGSVRVLKKQRASDERKASRKGWMDSMVMKDLASESGRLLAAKEYDARIDAELDAAEARLEADNEAVGGEGAQGQDFIGASNV